MLKTLKEKKERMEIEIKRKNVELNGINQAIENEESRLYKLHSKAMANSIHEIMNELVEKNFRVAGMYHQFSSSWIALDNGTGSYIWKFFVGEDGNIAWSHYSNNDGVCPRESFKSDVYNIIRKHIEKYLYEQRFKKVQ